LKLKLQLKGQIRYSRNSLW